MLIKIIALKPVKTFYSLFIFVLIIIINLTIFFAMLPILTNLVGWLAQQCPL